MFNGSSESSLGLFKDSVCTIRINKEKRVKIKFQRLQDFTHFLPYYYDVAASAWLDVTIIDHYPIIAGP